VDRRRKTLSDADAFPPAILLIHYYRRVCCAIPCSDGAAAERLAGRRRKTLREIYRAVLPRPNNGLTAMEPMKAGVAAAGKELARRFGD